MGLAGFVPPPCPPRLRLSAAMYPSRASWSTCRATVARAVAPACTSSSQPLCACTPQALQHRLSTSSESFRQRLGADCVVRVDIDRLPSSLPPRVHFVVFSIQPVPDAARSKGPAAQWNFDEAEEDENDSRDRDRRNRRGRSRRGRSSTGAIASQQRREAMCRRAFDRFDLNGDGGTPSSSPRLCPPPVLQPITRPDSRRKPPPPF